MSEPMRDAPPAPGLFETLRDDVTRVGADLKERGWRRQFSGAFSGLEAFYLDEADRARLREMSLVPRWIYRIWRLVRGLLMKLTPVRRVLFAIALVQILLGDSSLRLGDNVSISLFNLGEIILVAILMLELKDKLIARRELEAGRAVQLALLPEQAPDVPGWELWLYNEPANDVGGDLVDHMRIDDTRHGLALGDVAGKALPAALLMVKLQATLRALAPQFEGFGDLGSAVNRILHRDGLPNRFATLVYLGLTERSGDVRLLNAGHLPPLVIRRGNIEWLAPSCIPLGIMADAAYSEHSLQLSEGDMLVAISDGVTEAANESGEFFGEERLKAVLRQMAGQPAAAVGRGILSALHAFAGDKRPEDDVSLLIVRRTR